MIIMGYPGIGKSTFARGENGLRTVDLESSNFSFNGVKIENWVEVYCTVAQDLSDQGLDVFVSSHGAVQDELVRRSTCNKDKNYTKSIAAIVPSYNLKDQWIQKLKDRYDDSMLDKDFRAYERAKEYFVYDIANIIGNDEFLTIQIRSMDYKLEDIIATLYRKYYSTDNMRF